MECVTQCMMMIRVRNLLENIVNILQFCQGLFYLQFWVTPSIRNGTGKCVICIDEVRWRLKVKTIDLMPMARAIQNMYQNIVFALAVPFQVSNLNVDGICFLNY